MFAPSPKALLPRQVHLLELVAAGNSLSEAALVRGVSYKAIDGSMRAIRDRLEARTTAEAIAVAMAYGLVDRDRIIERRRARGHFGHPNRKAGPNRTVRPNRKAGPARSTGR